MREILRKFRTENGVTQAEMGRRLGVSANYVYQIESGLKNLDAKSSLGKLLLMVVERSSDSLLVVRDEGAEATYGTKPSITTLDGEPVRARYVPLLSWAQAGALDPTRLDESYTHEAVLAVDVTDPRAFALRIRGDSMQPRFSEGDTAILSPSSEPRAGEVVVARTTEGDVMMKVWQPTDGGRRIILSSYNPAHPPVTLSREDIAWVYPVSQVTHQLRK